MGLGLLFRNVSYRGPLGPYPAWLVPGARDTWAILVHGNAMDRLDTIKVVPALHRRGLPVLMISYRNDAGAPPDPTGMLRYGRTEWQDLAAAAQYALGHGARRLLLVGYSMGGAIVISPSAEQDRQRPEDALGPAPAAGGAGAPRAHRRTARARTNHSEVHT